jgi:hypothetical protein
MMSGAKRVTKEQIKLEVDKVRDEYLSVLYRIILALEQPEQGRARETGWAQFVSEMYGSTADAPLARWPEGLAEERLALE